MATRITFDMPFGIKGIDRTLLRITKAADDMRPAWVKVIARFAKRNAVTFREGQAGGWPALSPGYAAWKERHYPGRPILVREGDLLRSLTSDMDVVEIHPTRMAAGSTSDYGARHQRGEGVPKRAPIRIPEYTRREMVRDVQAHLFADASSGIAGPGVTVI